ncbi:C-X-C chemokine receptor type 2-like [Leucoraja erinacea]|uniref:C-X-C chemokine receptor type 2-like n=1 Tax=Leucoraja erinaceus TaxID=7782 RepID=UPI002455CF7F|nr:C-X-C chemokine receptor type 2-like [Leucoraja erinacea]
MDSSNFSHYDYEDMFENYSDLDYSMLDLSTAPCMHTSIDNWINVMLAAIYSLVCLLAVTGNVLVLLVILHNRRSISSTDVYLLHLATADLLFALTLPFWAVDAVSGWVFGDAMCKVISMLQEVNFYSGILLLACISVDRYLAIVRSAQSHGRKRPWMVKLACAIVWLVALLLSLPVLYKGELIYDRRILCYENLDAHSIDNWRTATRFVRHVMGFLVPLAAMVFCYSVTVWKLCQTKGFQKQKAMKVVIAVVLAFLACMLPHNVTVFVDTLMRSSLINQTCARRDHLDKAITATLTLGYTHSCINPILYAFIGVKFRRNLVKLLASKGLVSQSVQAHYKRSVSTSSESGLIAATI